MITKLILKNFKNFRDEELTFGKQRNIFIGENGVGKSTLLQAISLTLSGSFSRIEKMGINNLFNSSITREYCNLPVLDRNINNLPVLLIEVFFDKTCDEIKNNFELYGKVNFFNKDNFGIQLKISPNTEDYYGEIQQILKIENMIFPFEYYNVEFKTFSGKPFNSYKKYHKFDFDFVDTSLIDTNTELQKHINGIYEESINPSNRSKVNSKFRMTSETFIHEMKTQGIIEEIGDYNISINNHTSDGFKEKITVVKNDIDIKNFGQGEKVLLSVENSYKKLNEKTKIILIEEPENHLSHINMLKLLKMIEKNNNNQLFIATHSDMIASRLELDKCLLITNEGHMKLSKLTPSTVSFFKKTTHSNLLRFILSSKCILVEGNAEYILLNKFYSMVTNSEPLMDNVDIISVDGLSFKRYLEVAKILNKKTAVVTDNDKEFDQKIVHKYSDYNDTACIKVFADTNIDNFTFEVCIYNENQEWIKENNIAETSDILQWMLSNKAEAAFRILTILEENESDFKIPNYIKESILWIKS
ncbi:hypothetical protein IGJ39_002774 [Enterococcus sp. AZ140]|uniref:ATP-dependent nuclease n=1 Tax=Enterococcus sp. AZ140 TaxID=2774731 RepID=UPI003F258BE4